MTADSSGVHGGGSCHPVRNISAHRLAKKERKGKGKEREGKGKGKGRGRERRGEEKRKTQDLVYKALLFLFIENVHFKSLQNKNKLENLSLCKKGHDGRGTKKPLRAAV